MRGALRGYRFPSFALCLIVAGCAGPSDVRAQFEAQVLPVFSASCASSSCHGVAPGAEARGERIDWSQFVFRLDENGSIADPAQAWEAARRVINTREAPEFSTLVRKPLAVRLGGLPHYGGENFSGTTDPAYRAILEWIAREEQGGEAPPPLSEREALFARTVQPALVAGTCTTSACHGPAAGGTPYRLDPGIEGRFPITATRHNYDETLRMVTLDGFPDLSRVLRKARPLGPGILHKGKNFEFFAGEPGMTEAVRAWICAERRARVGEGCLEAGEAPLRGFLFVKGPIAPAPMFELDTFVPGSDLFLATINDASLIPRSVENLTAGLHPGPADVRDPAVSRDGKKVVFAMRTSPEDGHHLWLLDLETRAARPLTPPASPLAGGGLSTDRDPTFGPDDASVWFVSTRAGVLADQGRFLDAEVYSLELATNELRRWTYTPHVERKPVFFDLDAEAGGELAFTVLRDALPSQARAHGFRFPISLRSEYHQHFGITPVQTLVSGTRELPDGRYVAVVGELSSVWEAGALGLIERNFGPELNARATTLVESLPRFSEYEPPLVLLAGDGLWRDPAPLPDGRMLVAHHPGPLAPDDALGTFSSRLELLELEEREDRTGPRVLRTTVVLAEAGVALTQPVPVSLRAPVRPDGAPLPPSAEQTALFRHQGVPMIDALLTNLAPSGRKEPRQDITWVRLVEHLPVTPAQRSPLASPAGATTAALGLHGPARVLAELPLEADGSFQVRVPVGVPFRVQALDASRMAVGAMHNRWFYLLPGQVLTQGVSVAQGTARYGSQCAACHGAPSGIGGLPPELEPPDAVTGASLSLSRYERQNPRRPREPPVAGDATRVEVDFVRDVQPLLGRRCASCHGGAAPSAGLDLSDTPTAHFTVAYESLLRSGVGSGGGRAFVDDAEGRARSSFLFERLLNQELDAPRFVAGSHPQPLDATELLTLIRWVELGATFRGTSP